jgi:hypothetical protein
MLTVVEHQQNGALLEVLDQDDLLRTYRLLTCPNRDGDCLTHQRSISQGSQFDKPDPIAEVVHHAAGDFEGQTRLAHTARTHQSQ